MIKINLLPSSERKKRSWSTERVVFVLLGVSMLFGIFVLVGMDIYRWYYYSESLKKMRYAVGSVRKEMGRLTLSMTQGDLYLKKIAMFVKVAEKEDTHLVKFLLIAAFDLPEGVWLDSLSIDGRTVKIRGHALSEEGVGVFVSKLRDSGFIKSISMPVINYRISGSMNTSEFSFNCVLMGGS